MDYLKLYTLRLDTKRQLRANRSNLLSTKFHRITHITALGHQLQSFILKRPFLLHYIWDISVTKWIKSYLLPCFGTFKMPILMFISILVFRPEGQI